MTAKMVDVVQMKPCKYCVSWAKNDQGMCSSCNCIDFSSDNAVDFQVPTLFLSDADFDQLSTTRDIAEEAIDWCDLAVNIVYRVQEVVPVQTKWGARVIFKLLNREGENIKVWAPLNVSRDVRSGIKLNGDQAYIKSLGQKEVQISGGKKRKYFDFQTVFI